ncbi:protein phosphatase 2C domain-containing protein [Haliea sp. E1-2-M8]|uniref:PP2C family protein-serine/threonine phosphatase n=1 Tax=Haliea sp. E1-2-M8 TaxID=3064706 RepID=UPI0027214B5C|nr:protein phosphatase 2C domain-containing protein [Haliea sp. E1-2-M8]MDO8863508.1 protein phosphatase 2C domain-containing protein [Haliea sp. E1-2-M8]
MKQQADARWLTCGATDVGRREHNEDAFFVDDALGLMVVADGVGGHQAGEVASLVTCEVLARDVHGIGDLEGAIRSANLEVRDAVAAGRGKAGMATTVVAAQFDGPRYELAWVGDSRAYLWDGQLKLLTRDHSYVEALLEKGQITFAEARHHPRKNVIVQAIGLQDEDKLRVGSNRGQLQADDILVLCSDGLSDVIDCDRLAAILAQDQPLEQRCQQLVQTAVSNGGRDNVTVVLVQWAGNGSQPEPEAGDDTAMEPNVVWRYDPATGDYHGLPELVQPGLPVADDAPAAAAPAPRRARVAPRAPEATQMMSADEMSELRRVALELPAKKRRRRILTLALIALLAVSAAAAWFVFGPFVGAWGS